jgi:capsular polysaccharide transport system permease protein
LADEPHGHEYASRNGPRKRRFGSREEKRVNDDRKGDKPSDGADLFATLKMPKRRSKLEHGVSPPPFSRFHPETGELLAEPRPSRPGLALPGRSDPLRAVSLGWFLAAFVAPVLLAVVYYGLVASKQYVVEFHFTVRTPLPDAAGSPAPNADNVGAAMLGHAVPTIAQTGSVDTLSNYTVIDYVRSDAAARDLDRRLSLHTLYAKPGIDPLVRYGGAPEAERLGRYWRKMVWSNYDPATGLGEVKVRAFRPEDAYAIATNLVELCNNVINVTGKQSRADSLRLAQQDVDAAQARLTEIQKRKEALRNQTGLIAPRVDQVASRADLAANLRTQITDLESQLRYMSTQIKDPSAPQIARLRGQIAATKSQLAQVEAQVSHGADGDMALTEKVGAFEQLDAELRAVKAGYFEALARLRDAEVSAEGQRVYMSTYVAPAMPQSSTYPERLNSIAMVMLVSALVWLLGVLLGKSVMDHIR